MPNRLIVVTFLLITVLLSRPVDSFAQYKIRGTVYDSTRNYPLVSVSVISSSGRGAITNADGKYEIEVAEKDSIWFSYLNKPTVKFPVLKIATPFTFDIALNVNVPVLKEVRIRQRNYKQDSIQNREDYAKVFNYEKPKLRAVTPEYGAAAGFDLDAIINAFNFRKIRSMRSFQKRLVEQEQDKFVDHRFNKGLVRRLTGLTDSTLDYFMQAYRPNYFFVLKTDDYTFQKWIKDSSERFKLGLPPIDMFFRYPPDDEEQP